MERVRALVGRPPERRYLPMVSSCQVRPVPRYHSGPEGKLRGTLAFLDFEVLRGQRDRREEMEVVGRQAQEDLGEVHRAGRQAVEVVTTLASTEARAAREA